MSKLDCYCACIQCAAKVNRDEDNPDIGTCVKCETMQCMDCTKNEMIADIIVRSSDGNFHSFRVLGNNMVASIAESASTTKAALLSSRPFTAYVKNGVVQSIFRND